MGPACLRLSLCVALSTALSQDCPNWLEPGTGGPILTFHEDRTCWGWLPCLGWLLCAHFCLISSWSCRVKVESSFREICCVNFNFGLNVPWMAGGLPLRIRSFDHILVNRVVRSSIVQHTNPQRNGSPRSNRTAWKATFSS